MKTIIIPISFGDFPGYDALTLSASFIALDGSSAGAAGGAIHNLTDGNYAWVGSVADDYPGSVVAFDGGPNRVIDAIPPQTVAAGGGGDSESIANAVNTLLTAQHGGGSWQQSVAQAIALLTEGGYPLTDSFAAFYGETFQRSWVYPSLIDWIYSTYTIKRRDLSEDDSASILVVKKTTGGDANDGLQIWNGRTITGGERAEFSLDVVQGSNFTTFTLNGTPAGMQLPVSGELGAGAYKWAIHRYYVNGAKRSAAGGEFEIMQTVRRN